MTRSFSMRTTRCWGIGALLALVAAGFPCTAHAQAFPSSGEEVIRQMRQRYQDSWYRTLTFTERVERRTAGDSMVKQVWDEKLLIPGHLRIDVEHASPPQTIIYYGDSLFVIHGDSVARRAQRNLLLIMGFDVYLQTPERTLAELKDLHFPMTPVHSESWHGRPVFVIGAPKGDLHSPQLWVDQERLLFLRALEPDSHDSTKTVDYQFNDYRLEADGWLAETVLVTSGGQPILKEHYENVRMGDRLARTLFVPPSGR